MSNPSSASVLRLRQAQHAVIVGNCYDGLPDEACGLLVGPIDGTEPTGVIGAAVPCVNAEASARTYTIAPKDMLRTMRLAEERGEEIVGVWHSHTHTDAYPSPTDVRLAVDPTWFYVIVSLKHGDPVLRAYRIRDEQIEEVPVQLDA